METTETIEAAKLWPDPAQITVRGPHASVAPIEQDLLAKDFQANVAPQIAIEKAADRAQGKEVEGEREVLLKSLDVATILAWDPRNDNTSLFLDPQRFRWFCEGQSLLWSAATGVGKSSLLVQWIVAIICMIPFLGLQPSRQLRVIYIQTENNKGDFWEALRGAVKWAAKYLNVTEMAVMELVREHMREVFYVAPADPGVGLPVGAHLLKTLTAYYSEFPADIIIMDPLTSFYVGDISSDSDAREFLYHAMSGWMREHPRAAIVFSHHFGQRAATTAQQKGGADWSTSSYAQKGSTTLIDWFRASINVSATDIVDVFKLAFAKRGGRRSNKVWYITQDPEAAKQGLMSWTDALLQPTSPVAVATENRKAKAQRAKAHGASADRLAALNDVYALLPSDPFKRAPVTKCIADQMGASGRTISRYITELIRQAAVVPAPNGMLTKSEIEFDLSPPPAVNINPSK